MPAVFVHGVPDTARVWQPLLKHLERKDTVCLALPGFGNKRPAGFTPDKDSYADWIIGQLKKIDGPIDLVGHDWGSLLVTRVVSIAPDLIRTWTAGGAPLDPDYVWHDTAQVWQTPGKGEELMKMFAGEPLAMGLSTQGIPLDEARETARLIDDEMKASILTLYRSATKVADDWFADLKNVKPPRPHPMGRERPLRRTKIRRTPRRQHEEQVQAHRRRRPLVPNPKARHRRARTRSLLGQAALKGSHAARTIQNRNDSSGVDTDVECGVEHHAVLNAGCA